MSWLGWALAGYFAGALLLALTAGERWHADELAALLTWPLTVPLGWTWGTVRRWRRTCPACKLRYQDRAAMLRHRKRAAH